MRIIKLIAAAVALAAIPATTYASTLTVDIDQSGANVVSTAIGSVDTTGLTYQGSYGLNDAIGAYGYVGTGTDNASVSAYSGFSGPTNFGSGPYTPGTGTGDDFAINAFSFGVPFVFLDAGYVSGSALSGSVTVDGATLAGLGFVTGQYTYTQGANTIEVNVGPTSAVPEPATWALMLAGFGIIGCAMRKRAHTTVAYA